MEDKCGLQLYFICAQPAVPIYSDWRQRLYVQYSEHRVCFITVDRSSTVGCGRFVDRIRSENITGSLPRKILKKFILAGECAIVG